MSKVILFIIITQQGIGNVPMPYTQVIEMSDMDKCEMMSELVGDILEQDLPKQFKHSEICIIRD